MTGKNRKPNQKEKILEIAKQTKSFKCGGKSCNTWNQEAEAGELLLQDLPGQ